VTSVWTASLGQHFEAALDLLAAAVRDCNDDLWMSGMWEVPEDLFGPEPPGPDGKPVTDQAERKALVQRRSTPWSVAWHALECLDYDLTGEFGAWAPPAPFAGNPHWMLTAMPAPWTQSEILGYVDYCRQRVHDTLSNLTDEKASLPLPPKHRHHGHVFAWLVAGCVSHTTEHAAQIRQFLTTRRLVPEHSA
jgi:hypothetical protein